MKRTLLIIAMLLSFGAARAQGAAATAMRSIRDFGVLPGNTPRQNAENLQKAIDWAAASGAGRESTPMLCVTRAVPLLRPSTKISCASRTVP